MWVGAPTCLIGGAENSASRQKIFFCAASRGARAQRNSTAGRDAAVFGHLSCLGLLQWFLAGDRLALKLAENETIALQSLKSRRIM
jgi:hypothetical protein